MKVKLHFFSFCVFEVNAVFWRRKKPRLYPEGIIQRPKAPRNQPKVVMQEKKVPRKPAAKAERKRESEIERRKKFKPIHPLWRSRTSLLMASFQRVKNASILNNKTCKFFYFTAHFTIKNKAYFLKVHLDRTVCPFCQNFTFASYH